MQDGGGGGVGGKGGTGGTMRGCEYFIKQGLPNLAFYGMIY